MKKTSVSLIAFIMMLGICTISTPVWAQTSASSVSEKQTPERLPIPLPHLMAEAMDTHTTLTLLPGLKKESERLVERQKAYEEAQERFKRLNDCNIKRLSKHFKDPAAVWKKITDTYDAKEKELAIYINSAQPTTTTRNNSDGITYSDAELSELLLHWSLGNEILTDVYANQDKWGERITPKSPSFPLWKDQKYFFDKDWDNYYTKLNTFFGVPPQGRPIIDDRKYDYNRADETKQAHDLYLKALTVKNPKRALLMPEELKKGPTIAPRPLPPVEENVLYIGDIEQTHQIFPTWPEPWRKQIANNFANFNTKGEMAKDFIPRTFRLKNSFAGFDQDKQNNRLNVYQIEKKKLDGAKKIVEATTVSVKSMKNSVQTNLKKLNITASTEANLADPKEYEKLANSIKQHKYDLITQMENRMKDAPEYMQYKTVVEALKKDIDGKVYIAPSNAVMVDQGILEANATEALQKEQELFAKEKNQSVQKDFNEKCLLGD